MIQTDQLITCASWEDRFLAGFEKNLETCAPQSVLCFYMRQYQEWTEDARNEVKKKCDNSGVDISFKMLDGENPTKNWDVLKNIFWRSETYTPSDVFLDYSTMPREVVWALLWHLRLRKCVVNHIYHRPEGYNKEWLSRDPMQPRLTFKLSGMPALGAKTSLFVIAGYDHERTAQLLNYFEPSAAWIGLQKNAGDENAKRMDEHRERFSADPAVSFFEIDALHSDDYGFAIIESRVAELLQQSNIVLSSLGPKPSAMALFRVHELHPEVSLAYAPSREFNKDYSFGIGDCVIGAFDFS